MAAWVLLLFALLLSHGERVALAQQPTTCVVELKFCNVAQSSQTLAPAHGSAPRCAVHKCKAEGYAFYAYNPTSKDCHCFSSCDAPYFHGQATIGLVSACVTSGAGDPHFVNAQGVRFDFNRVENKAYCLVADKALHVNALFKGQAHPGNGKLMSWMKGLGFSYVDFQGEKHVLVMHTREGKNPKRGENGFLTGLSFDGEHFLAPKDLFQLGEVITPGAGLSLKMVDNAGEIKGGLDRDTFLLSIDNVLTMEIKVNAETEAMQNPKDAKIHFNFKVLHIKSTGEVHGLLGQSFQTGMGRKFRAAQYTVLSKLLNAPIVADGDTGRGYLDGKPEDYETSSLTSEDCRLTPTGAGGEI